MLRLEGFSREPNGCSLESPEKSRISGFLYVGFLGLLLEQGVWIWGGLGL